METKKLTGIELITEERKDQIEKHGWTKQHDRDEHWEGELTRVAIALACHPSDYDYYGLKNHLPIPEWGQKLQEKLKGDNVNRLKVAGALIAAEIDRLQAEENYDLPMDYSPNYNAETPEEKRDQQIEQQKLK